MESLADVARTAAIEAALASSQYFIARYICDDRNNISGQEAFQSEWFETADLCQRLLLLAPRDHAKTTNLGIWYPLKRLCQWRWASRKNGHLPGIRIGILSNTEGQAESNLRAITWHLENNQKLIEDFGPWKPTSPKKWTTLELIVEGWQAQNQKDVTLVAGGYGSAWLGRRIDLLIADDLADLKLNSGTDLARTNLLQWFKEVVTNCLEKDSQAIMIGTMQHHQDLYNTIIHEEIERRRNVEPRVWTIRKYKAVITDETPTTPAVVLWPEKNPYSHLMVRKAEIGTAAFEKQYQNVAVNEDLLCFKAEFLSRCLNRDLSVGQILEGWRVYIGVDPAIGTSGLSKFFVMVALAVDPQKKLHIVDVFRDKISVPKQLQWLGQWGLTYNPVAILIETNAYQDALKQVLQRDYPLLRVRGQFTAKNKIDPEVGIVASMAPIVENAVLQIPYGDRHSQRKMDRLMDELKLWPEGEYTDQVMALWIACTGARESIGRFHSQPGQWGTFVNNPLYPAKPEPLNGPSTLQSLDPQPAPPPEIDPSRGGRLMVARR